ncbi:hypothetical protein [Bacillus thuringiensis]
MKMKLRMKRAVSCTIPIEGARPERVGAIHYYDRILNHARWGYESL